MTFAGIVKSSLIDYPGFVSCVLFVPGCNYDCFYCHNRHLLDGQHQMLDPAGIEDFLKKRAGLLDAVVITGGEPTLQPDLLQYISGLKKLGYKIKLDTNGSSPEVVARLLESGLCDYYAVDYKAPAARYAEICKRGASAAPVLKTIGLLANSGIAFEVRTTVIPQLSPEDLIAMAKELPPLKRYVLNRYRKPENFPPHEWRLIDAKPYTKAEISAFAKLIKPYQPNTVA